MNDTVSLDTSPEDLLSVGTMDLRASFRGLAAGIIKQAIEDLTAPPILRTHKEFAHLVTERLEHIEDAKRFILSSWCSFLCQSINLDYRLVLSRVNK